MINLICLPFSSCRKPFKMLYCMMMSKKDDWTHFNINFKHQFLFYSFYLRISVKIGCVLKQVIASSCNLNETRHDIKREEKNVFKKIELFYPSHMCLDSEDVPPIAFFRWEMNIEAEKKVERATHDAATDSPTRHHTIKSKWVNNRRKKETRKDAHR